MTRRGGVRAPDRSNFEIAPIRAPQTDAVQTLRRISCQRDIEKAVDVERDVAAAYGTYKREGCSQA